MCGHATLGSAFVLMNYVDKEMSHVDFHTKGGLLSVERHGELFTMDFPSRKPQLCETPELLEEALGTSILETYQSRDILVLVENEETVRKLSPNLSLLKEIDTFAVIVTANGHNCDFVSRFFAPGAGIDEDPVTGSSHCSLIPFWSERLKKTKLLAEQLSKRGGTLFCEYYGDRVKIGGTAICYLKGNLTL